MMIPEVVKHFLIKHKKGQGFYCVELDEKFNAKHCFGEAKELGISPPRLGNPIVDFLPVLLTESFDKDFEIPFYNISDNHVCHVYFTRTSDRIFLILVDKSEIFHITKKYQQFAHDDNISKNMFKRLSEDLAITQAQLKKSNQEKATLIAMLSHELGTPLTSILGYSELLMNEDINIKKGLTIINRNAVYLKQMIENTLIFGRTEAGGIQKQLEKVSLNTLFSTIKSIVLPLAEAKSLKIQFDFTDNEVINIDITRTKQILINLLNNAVKYTDEGFIELKFTIKNNSYVFSVIDSGIGISKSQQINIFSPWERIEESTAKGAGIGLFISQKLAEAIGAKLSLKYSSKEFGSIFQLTVPIQKLTNLKVYSPAETKKICQGKSILIIDDDPDILELIDAFLYSSGLKIYTAQDMIIAEKLLKENGIDIILTDYYLGNVKSDSYVKKFKSMQNVPMILMTALPSSEINIQYKAQGFDAVLPKPLNSKKLIQTIVQFITKKS